jgi:hypothetical protein
MRQKILRISARAGLAIVRPVLSKADHDVIRRALDREAAEEKAAKRKPKKS